MQGSMHYDKSANPQVLVCGQSNAAVDEIVDRLDSQVLELSLSSSAIVPAPAPAPVPL